MATLEKLMALDSGLFDKIRAQNRRRNEERAEKSKFCCEWPGCALPASYKAPIGRDACDADGKVPYRLFCLEHVRIHNRDYNYFEGMSDEEIDAFHQASITGLRPTWSMGTYQGRNPSEWLRHRVLDLLQRWRGGGIAAESLAGKRSKGHALLSEDREALETLGFGDCEEIPARNEIKARYKSLIKRFHPDAPDTAASGKNARADHFIRIMRAHDHLKAKTLF